MHLKVKAGSQKRRPNNGDQQVPQVPLSWSPFLCRAVVFAHPSGSHQIVKRKPAGSLDRRVYPKEMSSLSGRPLSSSPGLWCWSESLLWWTVAGERLRLKLGPGLTSLAKATGGGSRHKTTMGVPAFSQDFNLRWAFLVSEGIEFYGITTAFSARSRNWEAQVCQMKL